MSIGKLYKDPLHVAGTQEHQDAQAFNSRHEELKKAGDKEQLRSSNEDGSDS